MLANSLTKPLNKIDYAKFLCLIYIVTVLRM
jgi:hypothetical protein